MKERILIRVALQCAVASSLRLSISLRGDTLRLGFHRVAATRREKAQHRSTWRKLLANMGKLVREKGNPGCRSRFVTPLAKVYILAGSERLCAQGARGSSRSGAGAQTCDPGVEAQQRTQALPHGVIKPGVGPAIGQRLMKLIRHLSLPAIPSDVFARAGLS
jgi:hypothetical protein